MKRKFRVLAGSGEGLVRLQDPRPRRIYRPGEIVELDDTISNVISLMANGRVEEIVEKTKEDD